MKVQRERGDGYAAFANGKYTSYFMLYFFFYLANGPMEGFLGAFFALQGLSMLQFGLFKSLATASFLFLPGLAGVLASRSGRSLTALGMSGFFLGFAGGALAPLAGRFAPIVYASGYAILLGRRIFNASLGGALGFAVAQKMRGKYFALRDLFLFGGDALGNMLAGLLLAKGGFDLGWTFFFLSWAFLCCCMLVFFMGRNDYIPSLTADSGEGKRKKWKESLQRLRQAFGNRRLRTFVAIYALTALYNMAALDYAAPMGLELGVNVESMLFFGAGITVVNAVLSLACARFADGRSRRALYLLDIAVDLLPALIFGIVRSKGLFLLAYALTRLKDSFAPISFAYLYDCFEGEDGLLCLGVLNTAQNALSIVFPILAGWFFDHSPRLPFLLGCGGILLAFFVALCFLPKVERGE